MSHSAAILWDTDLIRRYDKSGPRYTSYPTALSFTPVEKPAQYLRQALLERDTTKPLSLYLHIPFCAHVCYYCGCNKVVTADRGRAQPYLEVLHREIELRSAELPERPVVDQLHWGGGTPTFISMEETAQLMAQLRANFNLRDDDQGDYSIEIDPREMSIERLKQLRQLGFNRLSLGVQDLNPDVQKAVNRIQPLEMTTDLITAAREMGFRSINIDLIYGLPLQTEGSFKETLNTVLKIRPDRLSVFNYAHLPERFKPQRRINAKDLPDASTKLAIHHNAIAQLTLAGYRNIGMDHFALPQDSLSVAQQSGELHRNFQGYTTHGNCDLLGLGVSSISQIGDYYLQNSPDLPTYNAMVMNHGSALTKSYKLNSDDHIRRTLITRLICDFELNYAQLSEQTGVNIKRYVADELYQLEAMQAEGMLQLRADGLEVLPLGRLLIRRICMVFDAYINQPSERRYSKII